MVGPHSIYIGNIHSCLSFQKVAFHFLSINVKCYHCVGLSQLFLHLLLASVAFKPGAHWSYQLSWAALVTVGVSCFLKCAVTFSVIFFTRADSSGLFNMLNILSYQLAWRKSQKRSPHTWGNSLRQQSLVPLSSADSSSVRRALTAYSTPVFLFLYDVKSWRLETQIKIYFAYHMPHFLKPGY